MKKFKAIMMAIVAAFTIAGMSGVSAAAPSVTPAAGQNLTITRTITNAKNAVSNTFGYTITAEGTQTGVTGAPTTQGVTFTNVAPQSGTATAQGTIDMTGVTFAKNGDFTWTVEETSTSSEANYPVDSTNTYTITASVRNVTNSNLQADTGKNVIITVKKVGETNKIDFTQNPNAFLFTSDTTYKHIEISKEVTGNMADVDLCFDVVVNVGTSGQTYSVSGGCSNPASINGGTDVTLSLKHQDTIIIGQTGSGQSAINEIPVTTAYSYAETVPAGYTATNDTFEGSVSATQASNEHAITNNYDTNPITGTFLKVLPYVVIVAIAAAGVIYLVIRNKKQKQVEE